MFFFFKYYRNFIVFFYIFGAVYGQFVLFFTGSISMKNSVFERGKKSWVSARRCLPGLSTRPPRWSWLQGSNKNLDIYCTFRSSRNFECFSFYVTGTEHVAYVGRYQVIFQILKFSTAVDINKCLNRSITNNPNTSFFANPAWQQMSRYSCSAALLNSQLSTGKSSLTNLF